MENKKRAKEGDLHEAGEKTRPDSERANYYITALNTKRNPDLLIPGGALKGNMYFKRTIRQKEEEGQLEQSESGVPATSETNQEEEGEGFDDMFSKLKNQQSRYYIESNPTIKCRNCKEFGHMARECPNEHKRLSCILCGKDTHDSFDCTEKLCFKCNKAGHIASECTEKNIVKCILCN